jgi:hypothetical protein
VAGAVAGAAVAGALPVSGFLLNGCLAVIACGCAAAAFGVVSLALDGGDTRAVLARVIRRTAA